MIAVLVAPACGRYRLPDGFPEPDEMATILADIHVVESTITYLPGHTGSRSKEIPGNYKFVLEKHGLTPAEFDTIRKWYVEHPELYQDVYSKVIERLSQLDADVRMQNEREKELRAEAERRALEEKLQNLWQDSTTISLTPEDSVVNGHPFRIEVDTLALTGELKMSADYQFMRKDQSRSPRMMLSAFYNDSVADTVYQWIDHSFQKQTEELFLALKQDTAPKYIDGYLLLRDSLNAASVEISAIRIQVLVDTLSTQKPEAGGKDSVILLAPERFGKPLKTRFDMAHSRLFTAHYLLQKDGTLGPWPVVEMSDDGRVLSVELHPEGLKERPGMQLHGGLLMAGLVDVGFMDPSLVYSQRVLNRHFALGTLYLGHISTDPLLYPPPFFVKPLEYVVDAWPFLPRDKDNYQTPLLERIRTYCRSVPGGNWLEIIAQVAEWTAHQRADLKDKGFVEPGNQCGLMVIKNLDLNTMIMSEDLQVKWLSVPSLK
ncbi:hypothetical protein JCM15548_3 [Geofilum rubicundum JCM 15548]|uniref:DUF4296 domain-containing protein n=1 Tax=Geofilum rubicundum JCM 15548 TaxID=1236989 RepID=A0A0E9LSY6_9BACT|nr:hypothetical protein JCM15548_3 [Geofilum rubicundum JCM 15548]